MASAVAAGCLKPNPARYCGEVWEVEIVGAEFQSSQSGEWITIPDITAGSDCTSPGDAMVFSDPSSQAYQDLQAAALAECLEIAGDEDNTCAQNVSAPGFSHNCLLAEGLSCGVNDTGGADEGTEGGNANGDASWSGDIPTSISCRRNNCTVDDAFIQAVLTSTPEDFAADGTFAQPAYDATGAQVGWEMHGISAGNLGDALGFQSGDVVTHIDGEAVLDLSSLLDASNAILQADRVVVKILRSGSSRTLVFRRG